MAGGSEFCTEHQVITAYFLREQGLFIQWGLEDVVMSEFVENLSSVFELLGSIESKRMFGGHGIYHAGLMFALVADDELCLKVDRHSIVDFEAMGSKAFEYDKKGKTIKMSYFKAPEQVFEDPEVAKEWGTKAYDAALRNKKG